MATNKSQISSLDTTINGIETILSGMMKDVTLLHQTGLEIDDGIGKLSAVQNLNFQFDNAINHNLAFDSIGYLNFSIDHHSIKQNYLIDEDPEIADSLREIAQNDFALSAYVESNKQVLTKIDKWLDIVGIIHQTPGNDVGLNAGRGMDFKVLEGLPSVAKKSELFSEEDSSFSENMAGKFSVCDLNAEKHLFPERNLGIATQSAGYKDYRIVPNGPALNNSSDQSETYVIATIDKFLEALDSSYLGKGQIVASTSKSPDDLMKYLPEYIYSKLSNLRLVNYELMDQPSKDSNVELRLNYGIGMQLPTNAGTPFINQWKPVSNDADLFSSGYYQNVDRDFSKLPYGFNENILFRKSGLNDQIIGNSQLSNLDEGYFFIGVENRGGANWDYLPANLERLFKTDFISIMQSKDKDPDSQNTTGRSPSDLFNSRPMKRESGEGESKPGITICLNKPMIERVIINARDVDEGLSDFRQRVEGVLLDIINSAKTNY